MIDIFFQLTESEAASSALKFDVTLIWPGENSSHDLTFYLNNVPFYRRIGITRDTPLEVYIPRNLPIPEGHDELFRAGPNCLSVRRTGGGDTNPWIQFDALRLTAEVTAPTELIWQVGWFDEANADFEQESDAFNDPQFHVAPGDYAGIRGKGGPGRLFEGPDPEIWQDGPEGPLDPENDPEGPSVWSLTRDGFPRALVPGRPSVDIYFRLTAEQAQQDYLALHTILFGLGPNSSHDVGAYLNGTPIAFGTGITAPLQVEVLIPRLGVRAPGFGPAFHEGYNVLSLVRTGGGPVDPDGVEMGPWIQFDAVALTTALPPAEPDVVAAYRTVFSIGYEDSRVAEFEQESGAFNDPQYYAAAGDYSAIEGKAGVGGVWEGEGAEIWQDGPEEGDPPMHPWADTPEGFPRALVKEEWGRHIIDIFFREDDVSHSSRHLFRTWLFGPGPDSSHDVEVSLNGEPFFTQGGIDGPTYVSAIAEGLVRQGANVLSLVRTGGSTNDSSWILLDYVELITQAEAVAPPVPAFAITAISPQPEGAVTLTWEAVEGGEYTVQVSENLATLGWTDLAQQTSAGATASYTDTAIPAGTTRRFYRVLRTR